MSSTKPPPRWGRVKRRRLVDVKGFDLVNHKQITNQMSVSCGVVGKTWPSRCLLLGFFTGNFVPPSMRIEGDVLPREKKSGDSMCKILIRITSTVQKHVGICGPKIFSLSSSANLGLVIFLILIYL
jgi:hypothetical protein